jgi:hypothetical protein
MGVTEVFYELNYLNKKYPPCCDVIVAIAMAVSKFLKNSDKTFYLLC